MKFYIYNMYIFILDKKKNKMMMMRNKIVEISFFFLFCFKKIKDNNELSIE